MALINNCNQFGITVHYVDNEIDTGNIIAKKLISIRKDDNYKDLLSKAYIECPKLVMKSLNLILQIKLKVFLKKVLKNIQYIAQGEKKVMN